MSYVKLVGCVLDSVGGVMLRLLSAVTLVITMASAAGSVRVAGADDGTPTAAPTIVVATEAPPSATPATPVQIQAESSPVATATSPAVQVPPTAVPTSAGALPTEAPPPATTYLPSPAQLEESARLRWGDGVPYSVRRWAFLIAPAAHRFGLDPNLVAAVITMESNGDPSAWNQSSDARGLMQILHGPFDPAQNIAIGCRMLAEFLARFHNLKLALAAYNAGPNAVISYGGIPPYRETRDYVIIVTYLYDLYGHHLLSPRQTERYRRTLRDLRHFRDQRRKVSALAAAAHLLHPAICTRCASRQPFGTKDAFWPMPGLPDPLQRVGP